MLNTAMSVEHGRSLHRYLKLQPRHRNVRLGLAADGFNPFGNLSQSYSMWPVILTTYNLPPWLCMKESYLMLTLLIPWPKSRANKTYVGHRRFLKKPHKWRRSRDFNGETEDGDPPREFNSDQILTQLNRLPTREKGKHPSYGGVKIKLNSSDDEDLANDDDDDVDVMSADVARGHGGDGGGDDRPPTSDTHRLPRQGHPETQQGRPKSRQTRYPRANQEPWIAREFPMHYLAWRKIEPERKARGMGLIRTQFDLAPHMQSNHWSDIYKGIHQQLAKIYTDNKLALKKEHWVAKLDGIYDVEIESSATRERRCSNMPSGVPYTDDEINAQVRGGKQRGTFPVVRSDDKFSQILTQLESQPQVGSGSGSGGGGDDESGEDEDADDHEDTDEDEDS
ncbi:retrotransposon gag domain, retroviral aspartyl protease [Tanacetum coccineum]|uniref:Retrotransposon gag domain, retroviral aspartyl protease n=1 Tax=Tanacetum coccineum TaxID=301880 RepID=A0ABQ4YKT8_9ASTR